MFKVWCDAPTAWQLGFQDPATPTHEGIIILHDSICFYLVLVSCLVFWMLGSVIINYSSTASAISHKYSSHGTLIELIWTITPALILIMIAFPSFKLLYLIDHFSDKDLFNIIASTSMIKPINSKVTAKPIIKIKTTCTAVVPYQASQSSSVGININRWVQSITKPTQFQKSILLGTIIGDAHLYKSYTSSNVNYCICLQRFEV